MDEEKREKVLGGLDVSRSVGVEIGALDKPFVRKQDGEIIYVDHADRDALAEKYRNEPHVQADNIVPVDSIWGENTLLDAVGHRKVDYVVASHVIEHVPDLITWLSELRSILKDTGEVRLVVPDRRFTFDFLREESRLSDVLDSYLRRARAPLLHLVLDFRLNAATVDCAAAWEGRIEPAKLQKFHTFDVAMEFARDVLNNHTYHDVHCWVFTPKSFARLFGRLAELGLVDFACERFLDTEKYTFEFFVSLRPCSDRACIAESWKRMANEAKDAPDSEAELRRQTLLVIEEQADLIERLEAELAQSRANS